MKPILVFPAPSALEIPKSLFESPPLAGFQKTDFGVSSAEGAGNTKIGFIVRIADLAENCDRNIRDFAYDRKVVKIFLIRKLSYLI
ncbi:hypothetical protein [Synechococcus sp. BA-132 BA5]|uniref:hypothetical protein n=1 Tax=Synechococcus sp. BA-132 BA5 TaxID=3110252 RepID=UPI002B220D77|nr:hypothetical protein [Synechococcus sp. BA-132 BA5]